MIALVAATAHPACGQEWPTKPVRFIVPSPAGASNDVAARLIAERLSAQWKQAVLVENRPGAGTIIGTDAIAKAPADGHTFGWVFAAHAVNPSLYPKLPYDTVNDLAGVTLVYQLKPAILVTNTLPVRTVTDLIALAKSRPGELNYASPGTGSGVHLVGELFKLRYGIDMPHIAYKGGTAAHPDVIAGRVPVMFDALPNAITHIQAGKVKLLAVVSEQPVEGYPAFPIMRGLLPREAVVGWNGIVVPAKTPKAVIAKINADIVEIVESSDMRARLIKLAVEPITSRPEDFDRFIREDIVRWADVIKRAGIKADGN
jgi:tripartite-type tricarboxylate transporter receptor subunit TctC